MFVKASAVRISLQPRKPRNSSARLRKTYETKKRRNRERSPVFGRRMRADAFALQMLGKSYASQPRQRAPGWVPFALAGMAGFGPTNVGVKVLCLTAWRHPNNTVIISHLSRDVNEKSHKTAVKSKKPCL